MGVNGDNDSGAAAGDGRGMSKYWIAVIVHPCNATLNFKNSVMVSCNETSAKDSESIIYARALYRYQYWAFLLEEINIASPAQNGNIPRSKAGVQKTSKY